MSRPIKRHLNLMFAVTWGCAMMFAQLKDFQSQGKDFVNAMAAGRFSEAVSHFDDTMTKMMPADKLASTWQGVIAQAGDFKSIAGARQAEFKGYQIVFVSCHFSQSDLDAKVVYDSQGRVAGLFFVPPQAKPDASPAGTTSVERNPGPPDPKKPYSHREEEVGYDNPAGNDRLAATLTIPNGKGPFPAVVLIPGSGAHDRDETIFGHKPFLVLSDALTRKGIAVLRYDDRGVGKSTGSMAKATSADLATDAEAGISYLKTRPEIAARLIGLIGHSEGGTIAPMIAAHNHDVAFIVMLAGAGVPGDDIIVTQVQLLNEAAGMSHEKAIKAAALQREVVTLVEQTQDDTALRKALREKLAQILPEVRIDAALPALTSPWYRAFLTYDPGPALRKVTCPVLALNGDKDLQVSSKQNLPAIRAALEAGGNKHFEVDEMPGLNHLFQTAKTGAVSEYGQIEETMSPLVLDKIASWILKLPASSKAR